MTEGWIFVYNADSGSAAAVKDALHKAFSPASYPCALCQLSHGLWSERPEWRALLIRLGDRAAVLHRDEFSRAYPHRSAAAPAVWRVRGGQWDLRVGPDQWSQVTSLSELEALL